MIALIFEIARAFRASPQSTQIALSWAVILVAALVETWVVAGYPKLAADGTRERAELLSLLFAAVALASWMRQRLVRLGVELERHTISASKLKHAKSYTELSRAAKDKNPPDVYRDLVNSEICGLVPLVSTLPQFVGELFTVAAAFIYGLTLSPSGSGAICVIIAVVTAVAGVAVYHALAHSSALLLIRTAATDESRTLVRISMLRAQIDSRLPAEEVVAGWESGAAAVDSYRNHLGVFGGVADAMEGTITLMVLVCGFGATDVARATRVVGVFNFGIYLYRQLGECLADAVLVREFWEKNGSHRAVPVKQHQLKTLCVAAVDIRLGDEKRVFRLAGGRLTIPPSSRVLIHGAYGAGKSTLLKSLMGVAPGVRLRRLNPANHADSWVEVAQDLTAKLPWTDVTIRQLFSGASAKAVLKAIKIAGADALLTEGELDLERKLTGTLSGGQKSAAAMATRLAGLAADGKHWFALDECTTGMDPAQSYAAIQRISTAFPRSTCVVISHLERAETMLAWTHILDIVDGRVVQRPPRG